MQSRKGVVSAVVLLYVVLAFFGGAVLWKPVSNILPFGNNGTKTAKSIIKKTESKPVLYYTDDKGNQHVANWLKTEESNVATSEEPKLTLWQKIKNLGVLGIILCVLGVMFPGVGTILIFVWRKVTGALHSAIDLANERIKEVESKHSDLTEDARMIVVSVDEGLNQFDIAIESAKSQISASQNIINSASNIADPVARESTITAAREALAHSQAIFNTVFQLKKDFLSAMSRKQDASTKLLVANLLLKDTTNSSEV